MYRPSLGIAKESLYAFTQLGVLNTLARWTEYDYMCFIDEENASRYRCLLCSLNKNMKGQGLWSVCFDFWSHLANPLFLHLASQQKYHPKCLQSSQDEGTIHKMDIHSLSESLQSTSYTEPSIYTLNECIPQSWGCICCLWLRDIDLELHGNGSPGNKLSLAGSTDDSTVAPWVNATGQRIPCSPHSP